MSDPITPFERQLLKEMAQIRETVENGGIIPKRYLNLGEAALHCGFVDKERPDPRYRAFKKFAQAEEIPYKKGNGLTSQFSMIFDVVALDRAMKRNLRMVSV